MAVTRSNSRNAKGLESERRGAEWQQEMKNLYGKGCELGEVGTWDGQVESSVDGRLM
jgi:hypothetical protein